MKMRASETALEARDATIARLRSESAAEAAVVASKQGEEGKEAGVAHEAHEAEVRELREALEREREALDNERSEHRAALKSEARRVRLRLSRERLARRGLARVLALARLTSAPHLVARPCCGGPVMRLPARCRANSINNSRRG